MIPLIIEIVSYNKESNKMIAKTLHGVNFALDPFVGCAIRMSDEDYELGKGGDFVGKSYCMTFYTVYKNEVVPHEGGLTLLNMGSV
jgi:hypothetical protein